MATGPLSGFVIGVTADRRAAEQMDLLAGRGAHCVHGQAIATHPLGPLEGLAMATERVLAARPDIVVVLTAIGLRGWLSATDATGASENLREMLERAEIYCRGPKSKGAIVSEGLAVRWTSPTATSGEVLEELRAIGVSGATIAVQLDGSGSEWLCDELRMLGADVISVPVYRWSRPQDEGPLHQLVRAVAEGRLDAVTFTARPAVEHFMAAAFDLALVDEVLEALTSRVMAVCVGPVTAEAAERHGMMSPLRPARYRLGSMVQLLSAYLADQAQEFSLAGRRVRCQGRLVAVEGSEPVTLSERERDLLAALCEKPGAVLSKQELLRRVWAGSKADSHTVEVTIGRLRRRLGTAGDGIETVFRRGYRLVTT